MKGHFGKFLKVDLSEKKIEDYNISDDDLKKFVGGSTLAAKIIYDYVKPGMDPLSPENPLVFAAGPFIGSKIPMVSRAAICGISPQTGIWGESTTGGRFPFRLKGTGYDGIIITGKSESPVYISAKDGKAEINDASHLWGTCDSYATQEKIIGEKGAKFSVACIGSGGEKLIPYSAIMNDTGRAAGRCGLGALMGSKNLKAVAVSGNKKAEYADSKSMKDIVEKTRYYVNGYVNANGFKLYGTNWYMDLAMRLGDAPAKYYTKSVFPASKVHGPAFRSKYNMGNYACMGCPIGCGRVVKNFSPEIKQVDGPEYETVNAFGPLCMNFDMETIVKANHMCNVSGIDTISAGVSIAFAMHLFEKGVLTVENSEMEIKWGDGEVILKLLQMIIDQEGIGKILSKGVRRMAQELGADPEDAVHVKGLEIPMHDPRAYQGSALTYAVGPTGACHLKGHYYTLDAPGNENAVEVGITFTDKNDAAQKGALSVKILSFCELYNSFSLCQFSPMPASLISRALSAITGNDIKTMDLLTFGERSINLKRAINNRLGITRENDKLPRLVRKALKEGATAGIEPDLDLMLKEYYESSNWDWETGKPQKDKLLELGLDEAAKHLWG